MERKYRVIYDFRAEAPEELSVQKGELVSSPAKEEHGWLQVKTSRSGANGMNQIAQGLVPVNYLAEERVIASAPPPPKEQQRRMPPAVPTVAPTSVPKSLAEEHAECTICYMEMHERPAAVLVGSNGRRICRHFLHLECAQNLAASVGKTCPICRAPFALVKPVPDIDTDPSAWFKCVDADGNGTLSKSEVVEVLKALLAVDYKELERNADYLWPRWDTDQSGELDFNELCGKGGLLMYVRSHFARKRRAPPPLLSMSNLEDFFTYWDEDGNGTLELEEIVRAVVKTLKISPSTISFVRDYLKSIWPQVDPDNSGEVDLQEFIQRDGLGEMLVASLPAT